MFKHNRLDHACTTARNSVQSDVASNHQVGLHKCIAFRRAGVAGMDHHGP